jgi:hypothetical protein
VIGMGGERAFVPDFGVVIATEFAAIDIAATEVTAIDSTARCLGCAVDYGSCFQWDPCRRIYVCN